MYVGATRLRADARLTRDGVDSDLRLRYASMDPSDPFYNSCMREMPAEVLFLLRLRYAFLFSWGSGGARLCVCVCVCVCVFVCVCLCFLSFRKDVVMQVLVVSCFVGNIKKHACACTGGVRRVLEAFSLV